MLTKTSLSAIRALMYISRHETDGALSPRKIGQDLQESPTYMAKISRHLVKAGLLRAEKGVKGGVRMAKRPVEITLLEVVQACQGTLVGYYCQRSCDLSLTCTYHQAAVELQDAISGVLSRWTLAQLLTKPTSSLITGGEMKCVILNGVSPAIFSPGGTLVSFPKA